MNLTFRHQISKALQTEPDNITLFWKGRVALYALLKAFKIKEGDEVILPAFTCVVVPNAILYCGAVPVYVDIDPFTLNASPESIKNAISARTKLIIAQNTFGLSSNLSEIIKLARNQSIPVIEDCTHGFGGTFNGNINGTMADAAFFSTQWNKPFSTGIGGFAFVREGEKAQCMRELEGKAIKPSLRQALQLEVLLHIKNMMKQPWIYWPMVKAYRWMSKNKLVIGSSQADELNSIKMPELFLMRMSETQKKKGAREITKVKYFNTKRKEIARRYYEHLKMLDIFVPWHDEHTYLKFPILVKNRALFIELAERNNIELGDWFLSPIHPITSNFEVWKYSVGKNPIAEKISTHCVNLPTQLNVDELYLKRILKFLTTNKKHLMSFE
jgi:perosamine synthetase